MDQFKGNFDLVMSLKFRELQMYEVDYDSIN